jgi:hypothetical protein
MITPFDNGCARALQCLILALGLACGVWAQEPAPAAGATVALAEAPVAIEKLDLPPLRLAPFKTGEKLAYKLTWGVFNVGMLILEVVGPEVYEGQNSLHFLMEARTNDFADKIYKVRERCDTWVTPELSRSLAYRQHQEEGSTLRDFTIQFNWETRRTKYTNINSEKTRKPLKLATDTFDPYGIFFFLRTYGLNGGPQEEITVTDGKRLAPGKLTIVGKEKIKVNGKTWDAVLVEPDMTGVGGVFEKSKNAKLQVWFSDDARHLPLKVSSSVIVGSFSAELVSDTIGTDPILLAPRTVLPPMPPDPPKVKSAVTPGPATAPAATPVVPPIAP